ncbi:signal transduction histidine kinase/CheY-like chemotaxis protein [Rubrivivax gelatinosus]|uniref:hybrid sensor histidine kinase/response regulator n=3 Tax=Rubrivivax gelatinosus TaxID=28068 RepID=UPI0018CAD893|nr:ATP-binding protein [Rubrivivax gelatinosus]MBG6082340.1 signal transduction histidine kinase/CheY-like chemotaxis protein [Rubrivivax gelatinosus]
MRIRSQLLALVVALVVPIALLAGATLVQLQSVQRHEQEERLRERVTALRLALDSQVESSLSVLARLAEDRGAGGELVDRSDAAALFASQPLWRSITLLAAPGAPPLWRLSRDAPDEAPVPATVVEGVRESGAAFVSGLLGDGETGHRSYIAVPVQPGGSVLVVTVGDHEWIAFLRRYAVPGPGTVTLSDRDGRIVARTLDHEVWVGEASPPQFRQATHGQDDGMLTGRSLDGTPYFSAFSRLRSTGWVLASGVPVAVLDGTVRKTTLVTVVSLAAATVAALLLAAVISNRIAGAMSGVLEMAAGIAGGDDDAADARLSQVDADTVRQKVQEAAEARRARDEAQARALASESRARSIAEAASRSKDQYIAMLGHELRNPLSAIASAAEVLAWPHSAPGDRARATEVVHRQTRHLRRMVDDLLDATRLASGKLSIDRRPVELSALARHVLDHFEAAGRGSELAIELRAEPVWVEGDEVRLEQVVANLLDNACKYTPAGGRVRLAVRAEAAQALIVVADDGPGLEPELLPRVFDSFSQGSRPIDRASGGVGLGLAIVRQIVALHGGEVDAANGGELGGSVFTVRLARCPAPERHGAPALAAPAGRPLRVLIVEDNSDSREMLAALLQLEGHAVSTAADGPSGLEAIRREVPDLALVDLGLPGLDGHALAAAARAGGATTRLFALTGYNTEADRDAAARAGFDGYLVKPLDPAALQALLVDHGLAPQPAPQES